VDLFRKWDQKEFAYVQMLRFIRISNANPEALVVSKPGKHYSLRGIDDPAASKDQNMDAAGDTIVLGFLTDPLTRISSTMMTMDGPL
jgi:translation machinery-associated protein 16